MMCAAVLDFLEDENVKFENANLFLTKCYKETTSTLSDRDELNV